ncbi:hypothetical protein ADIS_3881 [Lunatimonas lonarensis]|uniref:Uncharacterized protein n=1 Tax=Lunatimonas lonarensis TaxID=1232681 RepID=R7ZNG5_9BACT|nr:hypothetical protein ADIS_3881 [Lunatimonas lonarensis]
MEDMDKTEIPSYNHEKNKVYAVKYRGKCPNKKNQTSA